MLTDCQEPILEFIREYDRVTIPFIMQSFLFLGLDDYEIEENLLILESKGLVRRTKAGEFEAVPAKTSS
jgi:hypothetical protein